MICLFLNGEPSLLLRDVKLDSEGKLKSGFVVNGIWNFEIRRDEVLAKNGNHIVNRFPVPDYHEVEIPNTVKGEYWTIMDWARKEYERVKK